MPSFEVNPSGSAKIVPVAVGDKVLTPSCASNDVNEFTLVTTNDPLYCVCPAPVILTFLSTLSPCLLIVVSVAIPVLPAYVKVLTSIDSPVT